jgi:PAS domain S-box-containing protein
MLIKAELMTQDAHRPPPYDDFALLTEISQMLNVFDQDRVLDRVIELTARSFGARRASLLLQPEYQSKWNNFYVRHLLGMSHVEKLTDDQMLSIAQQVIESGLAGWVMRNKEPALVNDTEQDGRWIQFEEFGYIARSALCVPFIHSGEVIAVLTLTHDQPNAFNQHQLRLMTIIANQATIAVRNAQLFSRMLHQQRQLEAILHAIPDVMLGLDERGKILLLNDKAAALLDVENEVAVGTPLMNYVQVDQIVQQIQDIIAGPLEAGGNWTFEARSERLKTDYLVSVSVWENPAGGTPGYVVIMRDVSTLRDLTRFKDEMLRMASHDLRGPLALIVGYCSLIELEVEPNSAVADYVGRIEQATGRMKGLLDAMVRVEKIRESPLEMYEHVVFADLVQQAILNTQMMIDTKQQRLQYYIYLDDAPGVTVNPLLLRESMENLISNASKYTAEFGYITVRAYRHEMRLYFEVEDTGIGIAKEHLPRLWQSFYRVPGTENIDGRGQGLSLVKAVVERHGGEVWADSELGKGSRFGFWIPI